MKNYIVVCDNGEYRHYSKEYKTPEEAEHVAQFMRDNFPMEWEAVTIENAD